ncbi:hypothetical protein Ddye_028076 [Dipteronia dyeriana]|uniref:Uncharacterized protein n=1 Tax=Dipteronia dyeriana TaxID=168575 RepID=A0AAD9TQZ8_9ROSI|nr:hypothetical protein Ddye_028076 [Dipteronia dyeriana]
MPILCIQSVYVIKNKLGIVKGKWEHCTEMESSSCWIFQRIWMQSNFEGIVSVVVVDARAAVLEDFLWAADKGWFLVLIESDAFGIVNLCTWNFDIWSDVNNIVFDILLLIDRYIVDTDR